MADVDAWEDPTYDLELAILWSDVVAAESMAIGTSGDMASMEADKYVDQAWLEYLNRLEELRGSADEDGS